MSRGVFGRFAFRRVVTVVAVLIVVAARMLQSGVGVTAAQAAGSTCDIQANPFEVTSNAAGNTTDSFTVGSTVTASDGWVEGGSDPTTCKGATVNVTVSWSFNLAPNSCGNAQVITGFLTNGPTAIAWTEGTAGPRWSFTLPATCPSGTPTPGAPLGRGGGNVVVTVNDQFGVASSGIASVHVYVGAPNTLLPAGYGRGGKGVFGSQADPVNSLTGAYTYQQDDVEVPQEGNPLLFRRVYNSDVTRSGPLGAGWTMSFGDSLSFDASRNATYRDAYGREIVFTANTIGSLTYNAPFALKLALAANSDGTFTLTTEDRDRLKFDAAGRLTSITDNIGRVVTCVRDGSGQLTEVDGLNGRKLTFAYSGGLLTSVTGTGVGTGGATTRVASFSYTTGQLASVTLPDSAGISYGYDSGGRLSTVQASSTSSPQSTTHYGSDGRVDYQLNGDSNRSNWTWDPQTHTSTMTDPRGGRWVDVYVNNYLVRRVDPTGDVVTLDWNDNGDLFAVTDGLGNATTFTFDSNHQLTSRYGPDGNGEQYTWNSSSGGLNTETNALGRKEDFSFLVNDGPSGLINDATSAHDVTLTPSSFSAPSPVASVTDGSNRKTTLTEDAYNNIASVTDPSGRKETYTYDPFGDVLSYTPPQGNVTGATGTWSTVWTYDAMGRATQVQTPSGATAHVTYDSQGRITQYTNPNNQVTNYNWDNAGYLKSVTPPTGPAVNYTYDPSGNLASSTAPGGGQTTYDHDLAGRLTSVSYAGTAVATYSYNDVLNAVTEHQANGVDQTRFYNHDGQLTEIKATRGSSTLSDYKYNYDPEGNLTAGGDASAQDTYTYDALDRLTAVCYATNSCSGATNYVQYAYDADSNLTGITRPSGATTYTYDGADRLTSRGGAGGSLTYGYDADGNRISDGTTTYSYNGAARIASATAGGTRTTYTYDGDGRRASADTGTAATTRAYLWDPLSPQVLAERDGNGTTTSSYVYGLDPVATVAGSAASSPVTWLTSDQINSIREARDTNGSLVGSAAYEPYGVTRSASGTVGELGYAAAPRPGAGGLIHLGARDYDPTSATFTTQDNGGGGSAYGYGDGDPVGNVDATGDKPLRQQFLGAVHTLSGDVSTGATTLAIGCGVAVVCAEASPFFAAIGRGAMLVNGVSGAILGADNCQHGKGSCVDDLAEAAIGMAASRYGGAEPLADEALTLSNSSVEGRNLLASGWVNEESAAQSCLNSFTADTPVAMADGTEKPIKDVKLGDWVIAADPTTGERGPRKVVDLIRHSGPHTMVAVKLADGTTVNATDHHPFWLVNRGVWVDAIDLTAGDVLQTADGRHVDVAGAGISQQDLTAYNLTVAGLHTYYAGADSILVHNTNCWSISSRLRAAGPGSDMGLPSSGKIRFVPQRSYNPANPLPRGPQGGYIDRFDNEWVVGPSRTAGQPFEWDVQLSRTGRAQLGWLSRDGGHINVSPFGEITH